MGAAALATTAVFNRSVYSTVLFGFAEATGLKKVRSVADVVNYPGEAAGNLVNGDALAKGIKSHEAFWVKVKNEDVQLAKTKADSKAI